MFFSNDLLTARGKFNLIWLVATLEKEAMKKRRKDLLALKLDGMCKELVKRFPVQGREKSFSLRLSAILTHGLFITLRIQADELRLNILRLRENACKRTANASDKIDVDLGRLKDNQVQLADVVQLDFGNIASDMDMDLFAMEDEEARRAAVTMTEIDNLPAIGDGWNLEDDFPRITAEQMQDAESIFGGDLMNPMAYPGLEMTMEPNQDANTTEMGPPVKPRTGSNVRIEETPDIPEDRPRRISPSAMELAIPDIRVEDMDVTENAPAADTAPVLPQEPIDQPDITQPQEPMDQPDAEEPVLIQTPAASSPSQLSLESLEPARKRPRRRLIKLKVDIVTQISGDAIKDQRNNYDDLLRGKTSAVDIAKPRLLKMSKKPDMAKSGIKLGPMASNTWARSLKEVTLYNQPTYDWDETPEADPADPMPLLEENLEEQPVVQENILEPGNMLEEQPSEAELRDGSLRVPDPDLSNDQSRPRLSRSNSFGFGDISNVLPDKDTSNTSLTKEADEGRGQVEGGQDTTEQMPIIPEEPEESHRDGAQEPGPVMPMSPLPRNQQEFRAGMERSPTPDTMANESQVVASIMDNVRATLGPRKEATFSSLAKPGMSRREVSTMFLSLLVANKSEDLEMEQGDDGVISLTLK